MNITQAFDDEQEFSQLLRRLQVPVSNVNRLIEQEGITDARVLANTRVKDLEISMTNINRLFGSHNTPARRIYFSPVRMLRIKALSVYFKRCLDANRISDIRIVDVNTVNLLSQNMEIWNQTSGEVDDVIKQAKIEFSTSKFTRFREKMDTVISFIKGCRGIGLNYLTRETNPDNPPQGSIEEASPNVNSLEFMRLNTTHEGPEFQKDNHDLFTLIRNYLTGTDGWNVISRFNRARDGRGAYIALRAHYEGASYHDLNKSRANIMMSRTFYRGDTTKFDWQKYITIHLEAHRLFYSAGEPLPE